MKSESKQTRKRWMRVFPEVHFQIGTNWYSWKRSEENTCVNIQAYCAGVFIIVHINRRSLASLGSLRPVFLPSLAPDLLSCNRLKTALSTHTLHNDLSTVQSTSKSLGTFLFNWKLNIPRKIEPGFQVSHLDTLLRMGFVRFGAGGRLIMGSGLSPDRTEKQNCRADTVRSLFLLNLFPPTQLNSGYRQWLSTFNWLYVYRFNISAKLQFMHYNSRH